MDEPRFHPLDYVSVVRRRKWWFIVPVVVCVLGGSLLAVFLPRQYEAWAEIGVAAPTLSPELLKGVSSLDRDERQRAISQQLLSRTVLERVVREERINPSAPVEDTVNFVRGQVMISVDKPLGKGTDSKSGIDSFKLGFTDAEPERTQRIANRLAYVFVEENARTRTDQAQNTSEVLAQQLRASQERLADLETQLRSKKEANMGRLPDQINANIQMVNGLRQQLESISMQLRGEQERLTMIETQIDATRKGVDSSAMTSAGLAAVHGAQSRINQLQQELMQARALGYTDKHPEIVRIQQETKNAYAELEQAQKASAGPSGDLLMADPMYRQKIAERDATRLRISSLQRAETQARAQIGEYQRRVEAAPMVEQDLASLTREHELEKTRYADLSGRHQSALMQEDVARKQGGERFSVLYPAGLPSKPVKPDLLKLMLMAVAIGLGLGAGLVVVREFLDRSVHDARALQTEFEIPVLGEIPRIHGERMA